jgi:hypothetical protein
MVRTRRFLALLLVPFACNMQADIQRELQMLPVQ